MFTSIALAALVAAQAAVSQQPLQLTCLGGGTARGADMATVNSNAQVFGTVGTVPVSGSGHGTQTVIIPTREDFTDQVDVILFTGADKIRLPPSIVPPIRGGKEGWYELKSVQVDARSIRAKAGINFINHPKVFIDRVTGTISIVGRDGNFSGQCQAIDPSAATKF